MDAVELEHRGFVATLSAFASVSDGGWVRRWPGLVGIVTGTRIPIFNALVAEGAEVEDADLVSARNAMEDSGVPWALYMRRGRDESLLDRLGAETRSFTMPGMVLHPIPDHTMPPELTISPVVDRAGHDTHVRMVADVFESTVEDIAAFTPLGLLDLDNVDIYLGHIDEEPVATSLAVTAGGVVTLFNVATVPDARRRGYGAAMTMAPALAARAGGIEVAALQSTEAGFPVYERLGYRTVVEYEAHMVTRGD